MDDAWLKVLPNHAPGFMGPLSRALDCVFAERADQIDPTDKPVVPIQIVMPARHYDDLERSVGGFPQRGKERPRFRGCELMRSHDAPCVRIYTGGADGVGLADAGGGGR